MERFFIIKDENLRKLYQEYKNNLHEINDCFKSFADKNGIETKQFYALISVLHIVPTENDIKNFGSQLSKTTEGLFRKNSKLAKEWVSICKEKDLKTPIKPTWEMSRMMNTQSGLFENRYRTRMFVIDDVLYGSYEIDRDWEITNTEAFQELKASEFWEIVEDYKQSEK